jgi:hypothetical protein
MDIATILQGTSIGLWVLAIGILVLVIMRASNNRPVRRGGLDCRNIGRVCRGVQPDQRRAGLY